MDEDDDDDDDDDEEEREDKRELDIGTTSIFSSIRGGACHILESKSLIPPKSHELSPNKTGETSLL